MSASPGPASRGYLTVSGHEPDGDKMARILYLDESGVTLNEDEDPYFIVAGVLVDADRQWRLVKLGLQGVANDWLPPYNRPPFFHANDVYHGNGYWDREIWPSDVRNEILRDLLGIIERLQLPVLAHYITKKTFGDDVPEIRMTPKGKNSTMHGTAAINCMSWTDRWLAKFAPNENATVTAEDRAGVRQVLRAATVVLRDPNLIAVHGFAAVPHVPFKHIIDGITFQRKDEAVALQLADLCAFFMLRGLNERHLPEGVWPRFFSLFLATRMSIDDDIGHRFVEMAQGRSSAPSPSGERSS